MSWYQWWMPLVATSPFWVYNIRMTAKLWRRRQYQKAETKRVIAQRNAPREPLPRSWCAGCDKIVLEAEMEWADIEADGIPAELYRCRTCRGVSEPVTVTVNDHNPLFCDCEDCGPEPIYNEDGEIVEWHSQDGTIIYKIDPDAVIAGDEHWHENQGDDTITIVGHDVQHWPGIGGPEALAHRNFDEDGIEIDANGQPVNPAIRRYRKSGIAVTNASNAAYERRIGKRARNRKRPKENLMWR